MDKEFHGYITGLSISLLFFLTAQFSFAFSDSVVQQLQNAANNYLATYGQQEYISGVSLSVNSIKLPKIININSGYTSFSEPTKKPIDPENLYQIGSITKSFVAIILLQLEAEHASNFTINKTLGELLPEQIPTTWEGITVKQLLNMTSGIPNYTDDPDFLRDSTSQTGRYLNFSSKQLIQYVMDKPLLFPAGTRWHYSNTNYILAGMVIEKLTGHSFAHEINSRLLHPFHLQNTYYLQDHFPYYPGLFYERMVHGYTYELNSWVIPPKTDVTDWTLSWARAAGALISTPSDVIQWAEILFTSKKLLPSQQRDELESLVSIRTGQPMTAPTQDDPVGFGLGIAANYSPTETIYWYSGGTLGYNVFYYYWPNEQITIATALNSATDKNNIHALRLIETAYNIMTGNRFNLLAVNLEMQ